MSPEEKPRGVPGGLSGNPEFENGPTPGALHVINTRMHQSRDLTDEQWQSLDPLIPEPIKRRDGRGRKSRRSVMNGILWVLRTGAPWPTFPTDTRRFRPVTGVFNDGSALE